jgi:hypothetical protein
MSSEEKAADTAVEEKKTEQEDTKPESPDKPTGESSDAITAGPKNAPKTDEVLDVHQESESPPLPNLSPVEIVQIFKKIDKNGTCDVPTEQFLAAIKSSPEIAEKLGMSKDVQSETGLKDTYLLAFGKVDRKSMKSVTVCRSHFRYLYLRTTVLRQYGSELKASTTLR